MPLAACVEYNLPAMPGSRWRCWAQVRMTLAIAVLVACPSPVPAALDTEIEKGIGNWMARAFIAQRGRLNQPPIEQWVVAMGEQLLENAPRRDLDHRFIVLDSPEANGFALPGGWIFITAGLLETMQSEDELAAVLAHELAHSSHRDFQRVVTRTALWLGLAQVLRDNDRSDWVPLVQGAQLVETLHHSREREAAADALGARIAWHSGYDPRAMAAFLREEPHWSYLQTLFATHPHPVRRATWLEQHFDQLRHEDPEGALALAESLIERGRCAAAADVLQEPLPHSWEAQREGVLSGIGRRAAAPPQAASPLAPELVAEASAAIADLAQAHQDAQKSRELARKRLKRLWGDQQIGRALVVAQAIDPELNEPGYLLLLAQSVNLLHRAVRGANLVGRTLQMRASAADGLQSLGGELGGTCVEPARLPMLEKLAAETTLAMREQADGHVGQTGELARLAGEYHECGRLVAPLLIELALAGERDPAGRLTFSRFMLIEARVRLLEDRLGHLDDSAERTADGAWRSAIRSYSLRINHVALQADGDARGAVFRALARRVACDAATFEDAWTSGVLPGDRALAILTATMRPQGRLFGDDLRASQILIRIAFLEVKEQVTCDAKGNGASKGVEPVAIRGAVGHPQ